MKQYFLRAALAVLALTALSSKVQAAPFILVEYGLTADTDGNVVRNPCGLSAGTATGTTVQGCLNNDHSMIIGFTSDEALTITGGQAALKAVDGAFDNLLIQILNPFGATFDTLKLNIDASESGQVFFTGTPGGAYQAMNLNKNGQNKFTITGEDFLSVYFYTTGTISGIELVADLKQVRLGGIDVPCTVTNTCPPPTCEELGTCDDDDVVDPNLSVPEPASMMLLGLGLLGTGIVRRRRTN